MNESHVFEGQYRNRRHAINQQHYCCPQMSKTNGIHTDNKLKESFEVFDYGEQGRGLRATEDIGAGKLVLQCEAFVAFEYHRDLPVGMQQSNAHVSLRTFVDSDLVGKVVEKLASKGIAGINGGAGALQHFLKLFIIPSVEKLEMDKLLMLVVDFIVAERPLTIENLKKIESDATKHRLILMQMASVIHLNCFSLLEVKEAAFA
jgi:hypothetical protein